MNNSYYQKGQTDNKVHNSTSRPTVFLAAPYSNRFDPTKNVKDVGLKNTLKRIIEILEQNGYKVLSAHVREDWGKKLMKPNVFVPLDYRWIKESDLVIAYVDGTSSGLYIEIGWASYLHKDILILYKKGTHFSPMIYGLKSMTKVWLLSFKDNKHLIERLKRRLKKGFK